ncbi:hypothetical protein WCD74_11745 [Actinomycetospora sp. OC33-EN08]|uniref:Uncharacterized protein n=1 Tax=Actinomycetospora aurantiaca TaxID=3129233 RepID=A0ABU8MP53_9PSEU
MTTARHRRGGWTSRAEARRSEVTTAQLLPRHLREGLLPAAAVGDLLTATPVIYASEVDRIRCRPERLWDLDEYGTVVACGVPGVLTTDAGDLDALEIGDRVVPVNRAGLESVPDLDPDRPVYVEGSVYLDTDLPPTTGRVHRLVAVRRYRLRAGGRPPRTEPLRRIPGPVGIDDDVFLHVADLVAPDVGP